METLVFKPCPNCGETKIMIKNSLIDTMYEGLTTAKHRVRAYCSNCGTFCPPKDVVVKSHDELMDAAKKTWNEFCDGFRDNQDELC